MIFHSVADSTRWSFLKVRSGSLAILATVFLGGIAAVPSMLAYGPRGFDTVVIDAGHGGIDRGGGPGQRIPEKPYTLDTAARLQRALRSRGFRTVMTRVDDTFIPLRDRVAIGASQGSRSIFVSVHFNSAQREGAHGYETYFYRSDSYGLASRLQGAMLSTLRTEDRHVRRRGFYVLRNPRVPAVLVEGGFLTNNDEARTVMDARYREALAQHLADAILQQSRSGDPGELGSQPPVTSERLVASSSSSSYSSYSGRHHGRGGRHSARGSSSRRHHAGGRSSSRGRHSSGSRSRGKSSHNNSNSKHHRHSR